MSSTRTITVGYLAPFVPRALLVAHGVRPRRLLPRLDRCGKQAAGLCLLALAYSEQSAAAELDGIIFATSCDMMRRSADRLAEENGFPVFLLNVPATWQTHAALDLYMAELRRLSRWLGELSGRAPGTDALRGALKREERRRVQSDSAAGHSGGKGVPLALLGAEPTFELRSLRRFIDACGGRVVLDATGRGRRVWPNRIDWQLFEHDPLAAVATAYFFIPDAFRRPDTKLIQWLEQELSSTGARGIILAIPTWCDLWRIQAARFRETFDLPLIEITIDGNDPLNGSTCARVAALVEMLR